MIQVIFGVELLAAIGWYNLTQFYKLAQAGCPGNGPGYGPTASPGC